MALDINLSTVSNGASSSSLMSHRRGMAKSCDIQMTSVFGGAPCPLFQPQYLQSLQNEPRSIANSASNKIQRPGTPELCKEGVSAATRERKWASRLAWKPFVDKMRILEGDTGAVLNHTHIGLVLGSFHIWAFLTVRDHGEGTGA
uniref:Uncharacterized protein n=1 Tax=Magallana gigas TaxID=29159 RepID=A0A8W8K6M7_MAGGI